MFWRAAFWCWRRALCARRCCGGGYVYQGALSLFYLAIYFVWMQSVRQRFLQRDMRRILVCVAALMIFWDVLRLVKYEFTASEGALARQLWYGYYIPIVLLPLLMFLAALYIGKTDGADVSRRWKVLYIPAAVVVLGIVTNDVHQLAFRFQPGFADWSRRYLHGPLYYAAAGFSSLCVLGTLIVVFQRCSKRRFLRYLWLPLLMTAAAIAYYGSYAAHLFGAKPLMQRMYELPEFTCLALIAFWEGLVFTHMIPSNIGHESFFRASSLRAGLTDKTYSVVLRAPAGVCPTREQTRAAEALAPVLLDDGGTLLKSRPVRGGHFYWTEDISELNRLNRELADVGDALAEEHAMLDAAAKLEESRARTAEQNRLYDQIAGELQPQLDALSELLEHLPEEEADFRRAMMTAGVLNAYVKRRSNLLLLANQEPVLSTDELAVSISESLEYVGLLGIPCHAEIEPGIALPSELALLIHALLEAALEAALPGVGSVLATLHADGNELRFYLELASPSAPLPADWGRDETARLRVRLQTEWSDESECITLRAERGGAAECAL